MRGYEVRIFQGQYGYVIFGQTVGGFPVALAELADASGVFRDLSMVLRLPTSSRECPKLVGFLARTYGAVFPPERDLVAVAGDCRVEANTWYQLEKQLGVDRRLIWRQTCCGRPVRGFRVVPAVAVESTP